MHDDVINSSKYVIEGERDHLKELGVNGMIILKLILQILGVRELTGFIWLKLGSNFWQF
jgi:hypothetical protein